MATEDEYDAHDLQESLYEAETCIDCQLSWSIIQARMIYVLGDAIRKSPNITAAEVLALLQELK